MDPFIGQIIMFGGNFAPRAWAFCDGQLLPIASNSALFSILGTTYGGDGRTTFGLPDLRGRVAVHPGNGPGLSPYQLGQKGGQENVTLIVNQIPSHHHTVQVNVSGEDPNTDEIAGNMFTNSEDDTYYSGSATDGALGGVVCGNTGGNLPHTNIQPYACVNYIIALQGTYPSRN